MIGSSLIGAAGSMSAAKQAGKRPPPRSYFGEMDEALDAQGRVLPKIITQEGIAQNAYRGLQERGLMGQMGSLRNLYGAYTPMAAEISGQSLSAMSPVYQQASTGARDAYIAGMAPGSYGLLNTMISGAQNDLNAGTGLTPEAQAYAEQAARRAMAARGLTGNQAIQQEVLNTYQMGQARQDRARQYAGAAYGLGSGLSGQAAQTYGNVMLSNIMSPTGMLGAAGTMIGAQGPQFTQAESQYMAGVKGQEYNTAAQSNMAKAQAMAGIGSGFMSMAGSLGQGYLSNPSLDLKNKPFKFFGE
jgi:hypothetical protein